MTVTYSKPVRIDEGAFSLSWTSDQATPVSFRVFQDRLLIDSFESDDGEGYGEFHIAYATSPFIEVLDKDAAVPHLAFPGRFTLHWFAVSGAVSYRVEEFVSAAWTLREVVLDRGQSAYSWISRWAEDVTTHQFRVIAVDTAGNQGTALSFSAEMVRHPDVPAVTYAYNGSATPTITISSA